VEWRIKLEARSGWGEVETIEVAHFKRRVVGLTAEEIGLSLEEPTQPNAPGRRRDRSYVQRGSGRSVSAEQGSRGDD
jgi:hypothetical protein